MGVTASDLRNADAGGEAAKRVLVVLSSARHLSVYQDVERKRVRQHLTGFFLSELAVPAMALEDAGYELVYASPTGESSNSQPDPISVAQSWFAGGEWDKAQKYIRPSVTLSIREVTAGDYAGVLVPGGHAPMQDLACDEDLGELLIRMAYANKPIAAICHGPAALLSAGRFFCGRKATCFSRREEEQEEPGLDNVLGGFAPYYLDERLEEAGIEVSARGPWKPHVVVDGKLITGQNPMSDRLLADRLLASLRVP